MEPTFKNLDAAKPIANRLIHQKEKLQGLGLLDNSFPIILVGGTNGKGSTANMLAQICMESGLKVGLNSSPHLQSYNERVQINRQSISDEDLRLTLSNIDNDFSGCPLNYPEYSFLCGLYAFRAEVVDIAIFEIGLGGRQDPANTLPADISIITNIDLDHTAILGDTIEKIAYEKAGIIKQNKSFICGQSPCPTAIQNEVTEKSAIHNQINIDFSYQFFKENFNLSQPKILESNAACAIQAAMLLQKSHPITDNAIKLAIKNLILPGRLQNISWHCPVLLDVAHNPSSCKILADTIKKQNNSGGRTIAIFAVSETKDISQMLSVIKPSVDEWYLPAVQDLAPPKTIKHQLPGAHIAENINVVFNTLEDTVNSNDQIIVFGSFYLIGEALCYLPAYSASIA